MRVFLTAKWLNLINITYKVDPSILKKYLPKGLELDTIDGSAFISLVAFDFKDTKVKGVKILFHVDFPEINLRFYVKHNAERGVVFIKEFVPKFMISFIANAVYNEPYKTAVMKSEFIANGKILVSYKLKTGGEEYFIKLSADNRLTTPSSDSIEHFFKEHSYGYGTSHSGKTLVYRVDHPVWRTYNVNDYSHNFDFGKIYGSRFSFLNNQKPFNVLLAEGSDVKVYSAQDVSVSNRA
ncbi:MAG: DUF2071 domain-containing protein [Ignavibacteria bacterium]